mmetsp:Transcript_6706/g.11265  ORF Transcript_6706/g.11265 Transcript_6706/m.11265 type:complete len:112 (-) Transcript_6706:44-379(-)
METSAVAIAGVSMFLALLFDLFVVVMFCDQISCIIDNTSTIDKLQKKREEKSKGEAGSKKESKEVEQKNQAKRTWWQNICEVFTGDHRQGFSLKWLLPTDIELELQLEREF